MAETLVVGAIATVESDGHVAVGVGSKEDRSFADGAALGWQSGLVVT